MYTQGDASFSPFARARDASPRPCPRSGGWRTPVAGWCAVRVPRACTRASRSWGGRGTSGSASCGRRASAPRITAAGAALAGHRRAPGRVAPRGRQGARPGRAPAEGHRPAERIYQLDVDGLPCSFLPPAHPRRGAARLRARLEQRRAGSFAFAGLSSPPPWSSASGCSCGLRDLLACARCGPGARSGWLAGCWFWAARGVLVLGGSRGARSVWAARRVFVLGGSPGARSGRLAGCSFWAARGGVRSGRLAGCSFWAARRVLVLGCSRGVRSGLLAGCVSRLLARLADLPLVPGLSSPVAHTPARRLIAAGPPASLVV